MPARFALGQDAKYSQRAFVVSNSPNSGRKADVLTGASRAKSGHSMTVVGTDEQRRRYFEAEEGLLRKWLDEKVLHGRSVAWPVAVKGSPFRGFASFGAKHASKPGGGHG